MRLAYKPEPLNLKTTKKIKTIGVAYSSLAIVLGKLFLIMVVFYNALDDNTVLMKNPFLPKRDEDFETGILTADTYAFEGGDILEIGGMYRNKYAIVKRK